MIQPSIPPEPSDVARHYDELDALYRQVWGEHVHHGVWFRENDPAEVRAATERLLSLAAKPLHLLPGWRVADIGCGYGAGSRWLAESYGVNVAALTLSGRQVNVARRAPGPARGSVRYEFADWLHNTLPDGSLDAAVAIESLAHMPDKEAFFRQLHRTLAPGGRAAIACWITHPAPAPSEAWLLRQICAIGRIPGMGTIDDYVRLATKAEFIDIVHRDLSREVEATWTRISQRAFRTVLTRPLELRHLRRRALRNPLFLFTVPLLRLGYRTGALRYALLWLRKPGGDR